MENQDNKKTLQTYPQYFGSFLNLARHNIFAINNHLAKKFDFKELYDEGEIPASFLTHNASKKFINKQSHIFALLKRFMPIAKVFDYEHLPKIEQDTIEHNYGKDFKQLTQTLKVVFTEINDFRNDYTHCYSLDKGKNRKLVISEELKTFLNINFERAIEYTKIRFKDVFEEEDFLIVSKSVLVNATNEITQDGLVFLTSIFSDRENAFQFIGKIVGLKGTQEKGFLAKREVLMAFCVNLPNEKFVSENTAQAFSLELIGELNKCPKVLYNVITEAEKKVFQPEISNIENVLKNSVNDSIEDYEAYIESITKRIRHQNRFSYFALKYIDQKELFNNLRFQIDLGKLLIEKYDKPLNGVDETRRVVHNAKAFGRLQNITEEEVLNEINKSTKTTSFEQYAPHYSFDNNKIGIKNLTKPIETSVYINKTTDKKVKAQLKQPVMEAFLSVNELPKIILLEYLEKGKAEQLINEFIVLNNQTILNLDFIKDIKTQLNDLDIFYKRSQGRKEKQKGKHAYHAFNEKYLNILLQRKQQLDTVLEKHNLNHKQIPSRIVDYWLNIKDVENKTAVSDKIKAIKDDCKMRLKNLDKGKAPKIGEMATYIAKDIVDMIISEEKKKKITSFYYDKMQECLALYADSSKKELFITICEKELQLLGTGGHPFLNKIDFGNIRYTEDIYRAYLVEKGKKMIKSYNQRTGKASDKDESWLQKTFYQLEWNEKAKKMLTVVKLPNDTSKVPFSIMQLAKPEHSFEDWFKHITKGKEKTDKKKPIDLPTNLFDDVLKQLLQSKLEEANVAFNANDNYSILFKRWWSEIRQDNVQPFYSSKRAYEFDGEELQFTINTKPEFKDYYQQFADNLFDKKQQQRKIDKQTNGKLKDLNKVDVVKMVRNKIGTTEKLIRLVEEEDRLMLLLFEGLVSNGLNLKLQNVEKLLNETIKVEEPIPAKLSYNENGERVEKANQTTITKYLFEDRKRKDYSILKKYVHDRRLPELFEYFDAESISVADLKLELDTYNKEKDLVFDTVFKLEEAIMIKDSKRILEINQVLKQEEIDKAHKAIEQNNTKEASKMEEEKKKIEQKILNVKNIQHKPYLLWLLEKEYITQKDYSFLYMTRNVFSHNQFPQKKTMELFITHWDENRLAKQIVTCYNQKMDAIMQKL